MRGNLCETQKDIVYPLNDNRAYDGPDGERNTARNYQPIIVGAKRANGKTYFCVKTKTTNHLTPKAKKSMATMGATCAVYTAMRNDSVIAAKMDEVYASILPYLPVGTTLRAYFMERIRPVLVNKESAFEISDDLSVDNPFYQGIIGREISLKTEVFAKFWMELAYPTPITFKVNGSVGIAYVNDLFENIIEGDYNILNIERQIVSGFTVAVIDSRFMCFDYQGTKYSAVVTRNVDDQTDGAAKNLPYYLSDTPGEIFEY